jgi:hypothetical protein
VAVQASSTAPAAAAMPALPKPEAAAPKAAAAVPNRVVRLDDRPLMTVGILGFGISIPLLSGLYGDLRPADARFWIGAVAFVALAAAIWLGNRWLLLKQREHFDWFASPWRKLAMLVSANVLFTAPLTLAALAAWFRFRGVAVDVGALQLVTLANVVCVIFVTHAYETVFLIREREGDLLRVEQLERIRAQAELDALKAQLDPHFLFNSLNTLGHLVTSDAAAARSFCDTLAEVYRYVLASRGRDLVPLAEELAFVRAYHRLLGLRFGTAIGLEVDGDAAALLPPLALQALVENAVKHNQLGPGSPLVVRIAVAADGVTVSNDVRRRTSARPSTGVGLRNLDERCRALTGRGLGLSERDGARFTVFVPTTAGEAA